MAENVHPGSWLGDSVEEFKKLPGWGKVAAGGVLLLTVYLGYRSYMASHTGVSAAVQGSSSGSATGSSSGSATGGGMQSPFGMTPAGSNAGSVPVLPSGINPVFDGTGNLIGWQNQTPSTPLPPASPPSIIEQIRNAFSQAGAKSYDQTHQGVPLRATPGGNVVGTAAFGSNISLDSLTPVSGPSNFNPGNAKSNQGSNIWYKTTSGQYVSQYDIGPAIQPPGASVTTPPAMPKV